MVDYKLIGTRIKSYRSKAKLTQELVAEQTGITVVYLSKIENGHVRPTIDLLHSICTSIHCDLGDIFCDVSPTSRNYQTDKVVELYNACVPSVKPIALNILEQLSQLK